LAIYPFILFKCQVDNLWVTTNDARKDPLVRHSKWVARMVMIPHDLGRWLRSLRSGGVWCQKRALSTCADWLKWPHAGNSLFPQQKVMISLCSSKSTVSIIAGLVLTMVAWRLSIPYLSCVLQAFPVPGSFVNDCSECDYL